MYTYEYVYIYIYIHVYIYIYMYISIYHYIQYRYMSAVLEVGLVEGSWIGHCIEENCGGNQGAGRASQPSWPVLFILHLGTFIMR